MLAALQIWPDDPCVTPVMQMNIQGDQKGFLQVTAADAATSVLAWMVPSSQLLKLLWGKLQKSKVTVHDGLSVY